MRLAQGLLTAAVLLCSRTAYPADALIQGKLDSARECVALFKKLDVKGDHRISRDEAAPAPPIEKAFEDPAIDQRGYLTPREFLSACMRAS